VYSVIFTDTALKQLKKLSRESQERIISVIDRAKIRPYPHVKKLVGCPYFRLRAGDYRIILDIIEDKLIIYVLEVGHRKNVYK